MVRIIASTNKVVKSLIICTKYNTSKAAAPNIQNVNGSIPKIEPLEYAAGAPPSAGPAALPALPAFSVVVCPV